MSEVLRFPVELVRHPSDKQCLQCECGATAFQLLRNGACRCAVCGSVTDYAHVIYREEEPKEPA